MDRDQEQSKLIDRKAGLALSTGVLCIICALIWRGHNTIPAPGKAKPETAQKPIDFEFYRVLPQQTVPLGVAAAQTTAVSAQKVAAPNVKPQFAVHAVAQGSTGTHYRVQVAAYDLRSSAEQADKRLAKKGVNTQIIKAYSHNRTIYRLQSQAALSYRQAVALQEKLQTLKIDSFLIKVS